MRCGTSAGIAAIPADSLPAPSSCRPHGPRYRSRRSCRLRFGSDSDVFFPRFEDVVRHRLDADWPVDLNGTGPANGPGRENEVGIPDSVIRMQMGYKGRLELRELKSLHSLLVGGRGSPDNARAHVNEV